jgi:hypothetical protein
MTYEYHIGVTGTQAGMRPNQLKKFKIFFDLCRTTIKGDIWVHIGDCIGADKQIYDYVSTVEGVYTHGHPPINSSKRAFCYYDKVSEPREYIERNHDIVDCSGLIIATPKGSEVLRSGTWATIRYTKRKDKLLKVIM